MENKKAEEVAKLLEITMIYWELLGTLGNFDTRNTNHHVHDHRVHSDTPVTHYQLCQYTLLRHFYDLRLLYRVYVFVQRDNRVG